MSSENFPPSRDGHGADPASSGASDAGQDQPTPRYPTVHYNTGEYRSVPAGDTGGDQSVTATAQSSQAENQSSQAENQDTGPIDVGPPSPAGHDSPAPPATAVWQPRPSGALAAEAWSQPASTASYPTGGRSYGSGSYRPENVYPGASSGQQFPGQTTAGQYGDAAGPSDMSGGGGYQGYAGYGLGAPGYPGLPRPSVLDTDGSANRSGTVTHRGRNRSLIAAAAAILVLGGGFGAGLVGADVGNRSNTADSSLSQLTTSPVVADTQPVVAGSVESVAAKLLPSVVSILSISSSEEAEGSGVILSSDGLILTNNHVIADATDLTVKFNDGTTASAKVIGTDATDDLAVIKVSGVSGLTVATLGSSANVKVGEQVVAVGSPLGLSATVTSGIVSALNRPVRTSSADSQAQGSLPGQSTTAAQDTVLNAIQTDAAINPGNSGGALVDMSGAVIGINSAIASLSSGSSSSQSGSIGVGFAIPIDQAHRIAQEIINTGHATHAVLGASVADAPDGTSANATAAAQAGLSVGAKIAEVTAGGGAAKAGLATDDVITKVGGTPVGSADALIATIRSAEPGSQVVVTFLRGSETKTATVTLGSAVSN